MLTLILLPGMDGTGNLFEPFIEALGNSLSINIVRYPAIEGLGYKALEEIARQSLPAIGQFVVLGESFSGPIAISIAASRPNGLVGLILCSTFARNPRPVFSPFQWVIHLLPVKLAPGLAMSRMLLGRNSSIHSREKLVGAIAQVSDSAFRARIKSVLSVDVSDQLKMVSVPVLCLHATQDWIVPSSASRHIAGTLPSARIILVVGPHCLLQAVPEETANVIRVFIEDIRSASTIGGVELVVM